MQTIIALAFLLPSLVFQQLPVTGAISQAPGASPVTPEAAFAQIGTERNLQTKKKLVLNFEKNFPKSNRLPEVFMDLSRALVSQSDFTAARQYAEKAVAAVARMKSEAASSGNHDAAQQEWLNSLGSSTSKNLAWVRQMATWQDQQVRSSVLRKR